ncbi:MAG: tetratricopeptide repeat protein, partial [Rhizobiales bacterium]|nr:tetratricopeptide repeat protein [Rhizobacter sp.]
STKLIVEAVSIIEQNRQQTGEFYAIGLRQLGLNALRTGDVPSAMNHLKRSTAAFEAHQPRHAMRASAHRWLGKAYIALDNFPEAESELRRSIELSPQQDQFRDFGVGAGRYSLAELFLRAGRFAEAERELQEALAINTKTLGPRHHSLALVHAALGLSRHQLGQAEAARASFAAALDIAARDASPQVGNTPDRVNLALAQLAIDEGRIDEAMTRTEAAAARWQASSDPVAATVLVMRAETLLLVGRHDDALKAIERALGVIRSQLGADGLSMHEAQVVLGEIQEHRAAIDEARLAYAAALAGSPRDASAASPTQATMRARAKLGMARLGLVADPGNALLLAREAQGLVAQPAAAFRERLLAAQTQVLQARALTLTGQHDSGQRLHERAVETIASLQAGQSPRLISGQPAVLTSAR